MKPWTQEDDKHLIDTYEPGNTAAQARALGRAYLDVQRRRIALIAEGQLNPNSIRHLGRHQHQQRDHDGRYRKGDR